MKKNRKYFLKNNIEYFRKQCGYSQQLLADLCGVSRNTICSLELGIFSPSAYLAGILCKVLHCKFEQLFYYVDIFGKLY